MGSRLKLVNKTNPYTPVSVAEKNEELFRELRSRGYYVQKIGQDDDTRYLVVSCEPPSQPKNPTCDVWD
jgi:hypothetical protein